METPGLDVRLSTEATAEAIKAERPDVLIIAVGSSPTMPALPGIDRRERRVGERRPSGRCARSAHDVMVAGAGLVGCETALDLAQKGKSRDPHRHGCRSIRSLLMFIRSAGRPSWTCCRALSVEIKTETKLEAITASGVTVSYSDGSRAEIGCRSVVLAIGVTPRHESVRLFEDLCARRARDR